MTPSEIERNHLEPYDLLFARQSLVLEGTGKCSLFLGYPEVTTFESHLIRVRLDQTRADPLYYFYFFKSRQGRELMQSIVMQVAASGIRASELTELLVPTPPLGIQRKIAAILSAYDDLIENNTRRIKLLEEMAQRIYREWFVDFRYPGHEAVPLADSQLGLIPVGWDIGLLKDLVDVNVNTIRGSGTDESIDYIDISSVERGTVKATKRMMLSEAPGRARRRVSDGDILWSTVRPNLCAYALVLEPKGNCIASTGFAVLSPRHASFAYIYALSTTDAFVEYLNGRATGSAYPAVTSSIFENAPVLLPPKDILRTFAENVEPHFRLASLLARKSEILRSARDLLTPRLISGEIDVTDLDIALAETAA